MRFAWARACKTASKRGDRVKMVSGLYAGATGAVEPKAFQNSVDYPEELVPVLNPTIYLRKVHTLTNFSD